MLPVALRVMISSCGKIVLLPSAHEKSETKELPDHGRQACVNALILPHHVENKDVSELLKLACYARRPGMTATFGNTITSPELLAARLA